MYKIAVLGDYDSIFGFAALGLDTFAVQTREEAAEKLHQLAQGGYGIIYITERIVNAPRRFRLTRESILANVIFCTGRISSSPKYNTNAIPSVNISLI